MYAVSRLFPEYIYGRFNTAFKRLRNKRKIYALEINYCSHIVFTIKLPTESPISINVGTRI